MLELILSGPSPAIAIVAAHLVKVFSLPFGENEAHFRASPPTAAPNF
jgi:hypothetical protein